MFKDSEVGMLGLVLDCSICHRLMIYPIHRPEALKDWNKHGRTCLQCIVKHKYPESGLEGYIEELIAYIKLLEMGV